MSSPTLSVMMTNFNHAHFLRAALQAIMSQSYRPFEIIVIDDASTDESVMLLKDLAAGEPPIRLICNEKNLGVVSNIQRLVGLCSGDYLVGLAADDVVLPGFFEQSMRLLAAHREAGLCSTLSRQIDEHGVDRGLFPSAIIARRPCYVSPQAARRTMRAYGSWIMGNTAIYRRQALIDAGGFRPELGAYCDGFVTQVLALRHGTCFIPVPLAAWRRMPGGFSMATATRVEPSLVIAEHAERLMRDEYADLFSAALAAQQRRTYLCGVALAAWDASRMRSEQVLRQTLPGLVPGYGWADALALAGSRALASAQNLAVRVYLAVRFGVLPIVLRRWAAILAYRVTNFVGRTGRTSNATGGPAQR